jgi:transcriptional regulator with XRE-family HTH domain
METGNSQRFDEILVTVMATEDKAFGNRVLNLRKERGWSQPELGKRIGTSGAIIGRYERGEITPSIEAANKLADTFGVTLDFLVDDKDVPNILNDQTMLEKLEHLSPERLAEIEDFIDFLNQRDQDKRLRQDYAQASEDAFNKVWDNDDPDLLYTQAQG